MMPLRPESPPDSTTATHTAPGRGAPTGPPPAYALPGIRTQLQHRLAVAVQASNPALANYIRTIPMAAALRERSPDPDEEPHEELSPMRLHISTRVNVVRDNNIVILSSSPAQQTQSIAEAVVRSFKSASVAEGGIPMVDQDGRPRPVAIEADAGITVEGANNLVGSERGVIDVMKLRDSGSAR